MVGSTVLDGPFNQLEELHISVLSNVASMALLVYDWQLTFGDEVNMIWMSNARVSKLLFLWIRYFGIGAHAFMLNFLLVTNPSEAFCNVATKVEIANPTIIWWSVEFVFALRVWILYGRSRKLLIFLVVMYIVSISVSFVLLARALRQVKPSPFPRGLNIPGCFSEVPDTVYQPLVIGLITTSTLCLLTVYRMLTFRDEVLHVPRSPLMTLFLRDGLLYYTCVNVVFFLNLFMIRYATPPYKILFTGFMDAVPCMLGARVLVNILALVHNDGGPNATAVLPYSEPRFAQPSRARGSGTSVELLDSVDATAPGDMNDLSRASPRSVGTITTSGIVSVGDSEVVEMEQVLVHVHRRGSVEEGSSRGWAQ